MPQRPVTIQQRINDMIDGRIRELVDSLQLSAEQQEQMRSVLAEDEQQLRNIRQDTSLLPQQKQEKVRDVHQATRDRLEAVLTPEQRVAFGLELATGPEKTAQQAVTWLSEHVDLADRQKDDLLRIFAEQQRQAQAVILDLSLVAADKRDRILRLRRETYRQVMGVLTGEQQQQLRDSPRPLLEAPLFADPPY